MLRTLWIMASLTTPLGTGATALAEAPVSPFPTPYTLEAKLYPGGTHVLAIGISQYRNTDAWPTLPNGESDADKVADAFETHGVPPLNIRKVHLRPGANQSIAKAVREFAASLPSDAEAETRVVVYYAGHGETVHGRGYLVPPDAPSAGDNPRAFEATALGYLQLIQLLEELPAAHVLLIIDACFSGTALKSLPRTSYPGVPHGPISHNRVLQVITAGTSTQPVSDGLHFAELISPGLTGAADLNFDGWVSGTELGMYLRIRVTETTHAPKYRGQAQTPTFGNVLVEGVEFEGENWFATAQNVAPTMVKPIENPAGAGQAFRDCDECPLMTVVPGPHAEGTHAEPDFGVGVFEVTFEEFDACFRANGCSHWPLAVNGNRGRLPVTDVSRDDAVEYTRWLTCRANTPYRLPTDAEWQSVAEPEEHRFQQPQATGGAALGNCRNCGSAWDSREVAPVGSFPASDFGLFDLIGNVWEWVADCAVPTPSRICPTGKVRGGGFTTRRSVAITLPVGVLPGSTRDLNIGFRVARNLGGISTDMMSTCGRTGGSP
jgi:formylglycine-generating enzyme required for sulfatase activity